MGVYCWLLSHVQTTAWNNESIQQDEFVTHLAHAQQHQAPLLLSDPATFTLVGLRWFLSQLFMSSKTQKLRIRLCWVPKQAGNERGAQGLLHLQCSWQGFPIS